MVVKLLWGLRGGGGQENGAKELPTAFHLHRRTNPCFSRRLVVVPISSTFFGIELAIAMECSGAESSIADAIQAVKFGGTSG